MPGFKGLISGIRSKSIINKPNLSPTIVGMRPASSINPAIVAEPTIGLALSSFAPFGVDIVSSQRTSQSESFQHLALLAAELEQVLSSDVVGKPTTSQSIITTASDAPHSNQDLVLRSNNHASNSVDEEPRPSIPPPTYTEQAQASDKTLSGGSSLYSVSEGELIESTRQQESNSPLDSAAEAVLKHATDPFNFDFRLEVNDVLVPVDDLTSERAVCEAVSSISSIEIHDAEPSNATAGLPIYGSRPAHIRDPKPNCTDKIKGNGKSRIPAIKDIDWSTINEDDVGQICAVYDGHSRNVSTSADSAVAFTMDDSASQRRQTGGKERAVYDDGKTFADEPEVIKNQLESIKELRRQEQEQNKALLQLIESEKRREEKARRKEAEMMRLQRERRRMQTIRRHMWEEEQERIRQEAEARLLWEKEQERIRQEAEARRQQGERDRAEALAIQKRLEEERMEEERLAAERARYRECAVCGDNKEKLRFPAKPPTDRCEHPPHTCSECLHSWMASEFDTKGTEGINCPECPSTLSYNDVKRAASAQTFEAFDKVTTRNALSVLPDFAWCLASKCGSGQLNTNNGNYMQCMSCKYKQCLRHSVAWHIGETCDQYDYRTSGAKARTEDAQTMKMLDGISKRCPGLNCGWRIQKNDGCDHMTCRKCRHEFCWQCLAAQKEIKRIGNTAHAKGCKFHSDNLAVTWPFNRH